MLHHRPCLYPKAVLQALLCAAFVFLLTNAEPAQAQTATGEMVYQPAGARLVLPENWRPTGIWAQNPTAGEQPNGLLFSGTAKGLLIEKVNPQLPARRVLQAIFVPQDPSGGQFA